MRKSKIDVHKYNLSTIYHVLSNLQCKRLVQAQNGKWNMALPLKDLPDRQINNDYDCKCLGTGAAHQLHYEGLQLTDFLCQG